MRHGSYRFGRLGLLLLFELIQIIGEGQPDQPALLLEFVEHDDVLNRRSLVWALLQELLDDP